MTLSIKILTNLDLDHRYILYHHSILSFLVFFPSFLILELLSALLLWAIFVVRSNPATYSIRTSSDNPPPPPFFGRSDEPKIKSEPEDIFSAQDRSEANLQREAQAAATVRSGMRMQVSEGSSLTNSEEGWEESATEMGEEEEANSSGDGSWENADEGAVVTPDDTKYDFEGESVSGGVSR